MNKKKIIFLFILALIGILCVFLNGKEEPEIGVGQNKVSFSNKTNSKNEILNSTTTFGGGIYSRTVKVYSFI